MTFAPCIDLCTVLRCAVGWMVLGGEALLLGARQLMVRQLWMRGHSRKMRSELFCVVVSRMAPEDGPLQLGSYWAIPTKISYITISILCVTV